MDSVCVCSVSVVHNYNITVIWLYENVPVLTMISLICDLDNTE